MKTLPLLVALAGSIGLLALSRRPSRPFVSGPLLPTTAGLPRREDAPPRTLASFDAGPRGIDAVPVFRYQRRKDGSYLYHILVEKPDGTVEDPSRVQGMR